MEELLRVRMLDIRQEVLNNKYATHQIWKETQSCDASLFATLSPICIREEIKFWKNITLNVDSEAGRAVLFLVDCKYLLSKQLTMKWQWMLTQQVYVDAFHKNASTNIY